MNDPALWTVIFPVGWAPRMSPTNRTRAGAKFPLAVAESNVVSTTATIKGSPRPFTRTGPFGAGY